MPLRGPLSALQDIGLMTAHYDAELRRLGATYAAGLTVDVSPLMSAILDASESSIVAVGFGGSFTIASLLCNLHESYTGRVSRAATSLELICNPTLAAAAPVFLISAEGKNPDIIDALRRARAHTSRTIHILTNRPESPLLDCARSLTNVNTLLFETETRDGYLATNSLLLNAVLFARAYHQLGARDDTFPADIAALQIDGQPIDTWLATGETFAKTASSAGAILATYSPPLRPIAADLESKLAECALLHCQLADLRSFAHGRHLWLARRPTDTSVLAIVEPHLQSLWEETRALIPSDVPTHVMRLGGTTPAHLLAGLVAAMRFVSLLSNLSDIDPGKPDVPQFGRDLHYLDVQHLIPEPDYPNDRGEHSKREVLGAKWPSAYQYGPIARALRAYQADIQRQIFRAVVFDYDGTLCYPGSTEPPPPSVIAHLQKLLDDGVVVGVASGRGDSVRADLRATIPQSKWTNIRLALYGGGWIATLDDQPEDRHHTSEFLSHVTRIVRQLEKLGVPIQIIRPTHPYHVSIRFRDGIRTDQMWFVIADALRQAGLDVSRVQLSAHSVDVLAEGVGKSRLIGAIHEHLRILPQEILAVGDQGAWPGNDYELLEHRYSLSVDLPSRRLDRGWKFAPRNARGVDATLWYLDRLVRLPHGRFTIDLQSPTETESQ